MGLVRDHAAVAILVILSGPALLAQDVPIPEYPLESLNIKPIGTDGMEANNRIFRAYPGLTYNIRAAVIGGRYPYSFKLTRAPEGMTVDRRRGEINWPNPQKDADAALEVTDSAGKKIDAAWTIHVATDRFLFVDAANGKSPAQGGTGAIDHPFRTISDFYPDDERTGLRTSQYTDWAVYFRAGTYKLDGFKSGWGGVDTKEWMNFRDPHPNVLMAYPGEAVTFDLENKYSLKIYKHSGFCLDGIRFRGMKNYGFAIQFGPEPRDVQLTTLRRLDLHGLGPTTGYENQSFIRLCAGDPEQNTITERLVIQDCVFDDLDHGSGIKLYTCDRVLIEDNVFSNFRDTPDGGHNLDGAVAFKVCVNRTVFRNNVIHDFDGARAVSCLLSTPYRRGAFHGTAQNEICHNTVYNVTNGAALAITGDCDPGVLSVYRNTIVGNVLLRLVGKGAGPFQFYRNVLVPRPGFEAVRLEECSDPSRVVQTDNLVLKPSDLDKDFVPVAPQYRGGYGR